jgi:hypothetical protein
MDSKNEQDLHLAGLISIDTVKQRRSRKNNQEEKNTQDSDSDSSLHGNTFSHDLSFYYKVRAKEEGTTTTVEKPICQKAFMAFHGLTRGRLCTIQRSLKSHQLSPKDMRGKHHNRPRNVPEPVITLIEYHISMFKPRVSHYSLRDNPNKKYLPETLTVKKMHDIFFR